MRRKNIIRTLNQIIDVIDDSNCISSIRSRSRRDEKGVLNEGIIESYHIFRKEIEKLPQEARDLLRTFGLSSILEFSGWKPFISGELEQESRMILFRLEVLRDNLPNIVNLFKQEYDEIVDKGQEGEVPDVLKDKEAITIIAIEEKGQFSNTDRFIESLKSIQDLFKVCAAITNEDEKTILLSCDSGSDKSFDILGAAKSISLLKDVIFGIWDRIVFYKEIKQNGQLDAIAKSLPIFEKISIMEKEGNLEPERAELLKRQIISGTEKFINCGLTTPDLDLRTNNNPRQLMAPSPKLLTVSSPAKSEAPDIDQNKRKVEEQSDILDEFSDAELRELKKLLGERRKPKRKIRARKPKAQQDDGEEC